MLYIAKMATSIIHFMNLFNIENSMYQLICNFIGF